MFVIALVFEEERTTPKNHPPKSQESKKFRQMSSHELLLVLSACGGGFKRATLELFAQTFIHLGGCFLGVGVVLSRFGIVPGLYGSLVSCQACMEVWYHARPVWNVKRPKAGNGKKWKTKWKTAPSWTGAKMANKWPENGEKWQIPSQILFRAILGPVKLGAVFHLFFHFSPFPAFGRLPFHNLS